MTHQLSLVEVLDDLSKVRNTLLACRSREQVIDTALSLVRDRLHSQTASIFIFSKDGRLERSGIQGIDIEGNAIDNDWFAEESYEVGESFTGRIAVSSDSSLYGKPQWFETTQDKRLTERSLIEYSRKIGAIRCAVGVPLNGQNRTYGVLEIINKLHPNTQEMTSCSSFSSEEIYWLDALGANIATSISNLRRNNQLEMLTNLGHLLVGASTDSNFTFQNIGKLIVEKILNPDTSFKVCILRIGMRPDSLKVVAKEEPIR
jgi:GAF domain-containing protein